MKKILIFCFSIIFISILFQGCFEKPKDEDIDDKIDIKNINHSLRLAKTWLISNLKEEGYFNYKYDPISEDYSSSNNMIRQLMASRVLAELSLDNDSLKGLHQKNLEYVIEHWYQEDGDIGYIYYNDKSKLGAMAMALRTLVFSPFYNQYQEIANKLANCILSLQNEDGSFKAWYIAPDYEYDEDYLLTFYSGEAILSLVEYYMTKNEQSILDKAILAQDFYVNLYVDKLEYNYYPAYVPWHTQSLNKLYKITENSNYADAIFVLNDKLLEIQDTENNETMGRFYNSSHPEYGNPHSSSDGVYTEGVAYAYEIAKIIGDKIRIKRYQNSLILGSKNLIDLQYNQSHLASFNFSERIIGAFRINENNFQIRVDTTQHTIDAFTKILELFE